MLPQEPRKGHRAIVPIAPDRNAPLRLEVRTSHGERYAGEVTDAPRGCVGMRFPQVGLPPFAVGSQVTLALTSRHLPAPIELPATVLSRAEMDGYRRYSFRFEGQAASTHPVAEEFYRLFNRRSAERVEPPLDERVQVQLQVPQQRSPHSTLMADLKDISATGMSVVADPDIDYLLADTELVRVTIRLPTSDRDLECVAWIRSRALERGLLAYALQFDPDRSRDFYTQQEAIMDYVMRRLLEELQSTMGEQQAREGASVGRADG